MGRGSVYNEHIETRDSLAYAVAERPEIAWTLAYAVAERPEIAWTFPEL